MRRGGIPTEMDRTAGKLGATRRRGGGGRIDAMGLSFLDGGRGDDDARLLENVEGPMLKPDDLEMGLIVTVLSGQTVNTCAGSMIVQREMHYDLKGVPMAILTIDLPYFLIATIPFGQMRIMDVREVELMRCRPTYVSQFQIQAEHDHKRRAEAFASSSPKPEQ